MSNSSTTNFPHYVKNRLEPAIGAVAIDYSGGDQDLGEAARGLYIDKGGDLAVQMVAGEVVTFKNLLVGVMYPFAVRTIFQTGSSAGGLVLR